MSTVPCCPVTPGPSHDTFLQLHFTIYPHGTLLSSDTGPMKIFFHSFLHPRSITPTEEERNPVVQWLRALTHLQGPISCYEKNFSTLRLVPSNTAATGRFLHSATVMAWSMSCLGECPRWGLSDSSANWWNGRLLASFWNSVISMVSLENPNRSCGNAWFHFM